MKIRSLLLAISALATHAFAAQEVVVSTAEQRLYVVQDGKRCASFPVSTSKFGLGAQDKSYRTPLGELQVTRKVGAGAQPGTVFKSLRPTGEILRPNTPGRDPIVTRVLCLDGLESQNRNSGARGIYIHGTPEEGKIGRPASYGCIRMKSRDVVRLFDSIEVGTKVMITPLSYGRAAASVAQLSDGRANLHRPNAG